MCVATVPLSNRCQPISRRSSLSVARTCCHDSGSSDMSRRNSARSDAARAAKLKSSSSEEADRGAIAALRRRLSMSCGSTARSSRRTRVRYNFAEFVHSWPAPDSSLHTLGLDPDSTASCCHPSRIRPVSPVRGRRICPEKGICANILVELGGIEPPMRYQGQVLVRGVLPAQPLFLSDRCRPQVTVVDLCDTPFSRLAALFPPSCRRSSNPPLVGLGVQVIHRWAFT